MTRLVGLAWPEVERRAGEGAVLIVPLGATEQHGLHLGLGTDSTIAQALADRLAGGLADHSIDALVAPVVAYGSSGEHQGFAGTLSIGQAATELLVIELVRSARQTFRAVVLLSAHGGNAGPLNRAVALLRAESAGVLALEPSWGNGDLHAGRTETSLQLVLEPEVVDLAAAAPGATEPVAQLWPAMQEGGLKAVTANGVLGDPTGASISEGERLLVDATTGLTDRVVSWLTALSR